MTWRIAVRATLLALVGVGLIAGLTVYFSTEAIPPCLASGVPKWKAPTDKQEHRFEVVVPDRALCFFDMDDEQHLIGALSLPGIRGISAIGPRPGGKLALRYDDGRGALVDLTTGHLQTGVEPPPPASDDLRLPDVQSATVYSTFRNRLGFRASKANSGRARFFTFPGYTWNPRFGPKPPDHGLSLAPDRPELWVLDAPNSVVHLFDVSGTWPRRITDIRLTRPLSGDENPCATGRCVRIGSLQHSNDGRFVYVGDAGDVIDAKKREEIANLEALHESRLTVEVDWFGGRPSFAGTR
ncbi:MAG: hypothetical protein E6G13_09105 [Actinobacteria bacterium]|nr:MAG: hypothetical protein E6G13_09105 [Actinomycetota bacterium]